MENHTVNNSFELEPGKHVSFTEKKREYLYQETNYLFYGIFNHHRTCTPCNLHPYIH